MSKATKRGRPSQSPDASSTVSVHFRVTPAEFKHLMRHYDASVYPTRSAYLRAVMLGRVTVKAARSDSIDAAAAAIAAYNDEWRSIGSNLNQLVRVMNTYKSPLTEKQYVTTMALLLEMADRQEKVRDVIHKLAAQWSQCNS